ncbi:unnamed protein product [Vitrella brassicaformis CCMP3155]|uniref:Uncharacterized protein n=1 Tax=Vitrella brassicaformis (strain CCMP3155) TaxID=1169540 RepID=A0A0G4EF84_VITBC|nr:unnamed protein product [Vitrella brassicaformis CCMP3155]|eukprot:CEL94058.1 unnamed protein product [Vitrella brassicaformis CCMP3155]
MLSVTWNLRRLGRVVAMHGCDVSSPIWVPRPRHAPPPPPFLRAAVKSSSHCFHPLCQQVSSSRVAEGDLVSCSQPPKNLPEEPIDISCSVKVPEAFRKRIQADLRDSLDERGKDTLGVVLRLRGVEPTRLVVSLQKVEGLDVTGGDCLLEIDGSWSGPRTCYLASLNKADKLNGNTMLVGMLSWIDQFSPAYNCTEVTIFDLSSIKEMYVLSKGDGIEECKKMTSSLFDRNADILPTAEFNLVNKIHRIYKRILDVNINDGAATLEQLEQLRRRTVEGVKHESLAGLRIVFDVLKAWPKVEKMTLTIDRSYPPGSTAHQIMCLIQSAHLVLVTSEDKEVLRKEMEENPSLNLLRSSLPDDAQYCLFVADGVRQLNDTHAYSLVEEFAPELLQESGKRQKEEAKD